MIQTNILPAHRILPWPLCLHPLNSYSSSFLFTHSIKSFWACPMCQGLCQATNYMPSLTAEHDSKMELLLLLRKCWCRGYNKSLAKAWDGEEGVQATLKSRIAELTPCTLPTTTLWFSFALKNDYNWVLAVPSYIVVLKVWGRVCSGP